MSRRKKRLIVLLGLLILLAAAFFLYTGSYYPADETARAALGSDGRVQVLERDYGLLFDGPSETDALIFYPGGKVEETAYAPLLRTLAEEGMDVCLVKMPFRLAFFGMNRADAVMAEEDYDHWVLGGHSLGGAVAALYAAEHPDGLKGLVLLAAYPTRPLEERLQVLTVYGSRDGILNRKKLEEGAAYLPESALSLVLEGGNHAQFGNYGLQAGDGAAQIPAERQQAETAAFLLEKLQTD